MIAYLKTLMDISIFAPIRVLSVANPGLWTRVKTWFLNSLVPDCEQSGLCDVNGDEFSPYWVNFACSDWSQIPQAWVKSQASRDFGLGPGPVSVSSHESTDESKSFLNSVSLCDSAHARSKLVFRDS